MKDFLTFFIALVLAAGVFGGLGYGIGSQFDLGSGGP
jgi:hypothetical protein